MQVNGIDLSALPSQVEGADYPNEVKGRVVQIDADFLAYQVAYVREGEEKSFEDMAHNADVSIKHIRRLAGAEHYKLHVTGNGSNKGGRYNQAILKEYQANRADKEKPEMLEAIRDWMVSARDGVNHLDIEADDGIVIEQQKAIDEGNANLSVIASRDKDLRMAHGLLLDMETGEIRESGGYGSLWLDDTKSTKKLVGVGPAFFFAQLLMGDTADNISGVPHVSGGVLNTYDPTAGVLAAQATLAKGDGVSPAKAAAARKALDTRKPKNCGHVLTYKILKDCTSIKSAWERIKLVYREAYSADASAFKHWKDGRAISASACLVAECQLLWMRRAKDPMDFASMLRAAA